jgi:predicted ATPase/DNA-binding winged helix-turn-helix (wHTH) protein
MLDQAITFGGFRLDPGAGLTHGARAVRLTPKAFSLLCYLAAERGRVVGKEELFRAVWRGAVVGDAALVTCVQELRRALGDRAGKPRYIETLHRRGYRFIADAAGNPPPAELPGFTGPDAAVLVGRRRERAALDEALAAARAGSRQVVLVAGEAGIGKTSLVREFLTRTAGPAPVRLAWGQSAEHYGPSEPYHPILDALSRACRGRSGDPLVKALEAHAPLWVAQMPSIVSASRLRAAQRRSAGATPERMQRELTDALEAAAGEVPIVLWLEDLHWSDVPTMDWLAAFARRPERVRILVLGTYRPVEARAERHALHVLGDELVRQGHARTVLLGPLSAESVEDYVVARFPPRPDAAPGVAELARTVYARTEGSPLFMVGVLNELVERGILRGEGGTWAVSGPASAAGLGIPAYLRQMIDRQIDRLAAGSRDLLEAASVAGLHFAAALPAAAAGRPVAEVENALRDIAREHPLIVPAGTEEWPDGTVSTRFSFAHALYRESLAARLTAGHAVEIHRRVAERLAAAYGERADEVAAQLAMHFERGRDVLAAVDWLRRAGDGAMRRKAAREAAAHYEHALELAGGLSRGRMRDELEARVCLALCAPLIAVHGMGSPRIEACATQALETCAALGDARGHFAAHRVLWNNSLMRHPVPVTLRCAREVMDEARAYGDPVELALAHRALGSTLIYVGQHQEAARLLAQGAALADPIADMAFERYGEHPGMVCRAFCAWPKAFMGLTDEAVRLSDESIRHARRRDEPQGLAFALVTAGLVDLFNRDAQRADAVAREVRALSEQYRLAQWIAFADEIEGWVAFQSGEHGRGIDLMRQGLDRLHATGARTHTSRLLANLAESCLCAGRLQEARRYLDAAFAHRVAHEEHYYAPELYRLNGLLLQRQGFPWGQVQAAMDEAIRIARTQGAGLFERRAERVSAELQS